MNDKEYNEKNVYQHNDKTKKNIKGFGKTFFLNVRLTYCSSCNTLKSD